MHVSSLRPHLMPRFAASSAKILYSGLFLQPDNPLKDWPVPAGWTRYAHHATLAFQPRGGFPVTSGTLDVLGIYQTPEVIYARIAPPPEISAWCQQNQLPEPPWHITIATAPKIKPVRAKEATEKGEGTLIQSFTPPMQLPFQAGGFDGNDVVTQSP